VGVRIAYLLRVLRRPASVLESRAGAGCMEAQSGRTALHHARACCMFGWRGHFERRVVVVGMGGEQC